MYRVAVDPLIPFSFFFPTEARRDRYPQTTKTCLSDWSFSTVPLLPFIFQVRQVVLFFLFFVFLLIV